MGPTRTYLYSLPSRIHPFVKPGRLLTGALALVMLAVFLLPFAQAAPAASAVPARAPPAPAVAGACNASPNPYLQIYTGYDVNGQFVSACRYNPGLWTGENRVYFEIYDGFRDNQANVSLIDPFATQDGLSSPVAQATVPLVVGPVESSVDSTQLVPPVGFTIPTTLVQGGTWVLNVTTGTGASHTAEVSLTVDTFYVNLQLSTQYLLPGQDVTGSFQVLSYATGGPLSPAPSLHLSGCYYGNGNASCVGFPNLPTLPSESQGGFTLQAPSNATYFTSPSLELTANYTAATRSQVHSASTSFELLEVDKAILCPAATLANFPLVFPGYCFGSSTTYTLGTPVFLGVLTTLGDPASGSVDQPLPQAPVSFAYRLNGQPLTSAGLPANLTTDSSGFGLASLSTTGLAAGALSVTVSTLGPGGLGNVTIRSLNLSLVPQTAPVQVDLTFNETSYIAGSLLGGTYRVVNQTTGGAPPAGWTAFYYEILSYPFDYGACSGSSYLAQSGNLSGTSGSLPAYNGGPNARGALLIIVAAHNGTFTAPPGAAASACLSVSVPGIAIIPSESAYSPGDQVSVSIVPVDRTFSGDTFEVSVTGLPWLVPPPVPVLYQANLTSPSFSFRIPEVGALSSYEINVLVLGPGHTTVASSSTQINENIGLQLTLSVATPSRYSDGSYQPGETLSIDYTLTGFGGVTTNGTFDIVYYFEDLSTSSQVLILTSASGSFSVTIPGNAGNGLLVLYASGNTPLINPEYYFGTFTGFTVNSHPSALGYELVPSSGFTLGLLILVVLLIVVGLVAYLFYRRVTYRAGPGRPGHFEREHGPKGEALPAWTPGSPPAAEKAPASPPPAEGSAGTGAGEPPRPPPPSPPQDYVE